MKREQDRISNEIRTCKRALKASEADAEQIERTTARAVSADENCHQTYLAAGRPSAS